MTEEDTAKLFDKLQEAKKLKYDLMDEIYYVQEKLEDDLILDEDKIKFAKDSLRKMFHRIHETI